MSHNIIHRDYPQDVNQKSVKAEIDHYVAMEDWQEGATGLYREIRWLDGKIYDGYEEAEEAIEKLDRGDYDNLAVLYYVNPVKAVSKGALNAASAVNTYQASYIELRDKIRADFFHTKTEFVTCKECGSKLSKKHLGLLGTTNCPLCKKNLLSDTATSRLMKAHDKIVAAQKKQKEILQKQNRKPASTKREVRWLVKAEYHT